MFWNALWFKRNEQLKKRRFSLMRIQAGSGEPVVEFSWQVALSGMRRWRVTTWEPRPESVGALSF